MGNGEHDELGERDTLDQQEGAVGAEKRSALSALLGDFALAAVEGFFVRLPRFTVAGCAGRTP
jgi:hypothetical protein